MKIISKKYYRGVANLICIGLLSLPLSGQNTKKMGRIIEHTMRKGETLYSLAHHYGVSLEKVYELNPWARTQLLEGDKVLFPTGEAYRSGGIRTHEVQQGETIYRICRTYGISEEALMEANPHISRDSFRIGTILTIPTGYTAVDTIAPRVSPPKAEDNVVEEQAPVRVLLMLPISTKPRNLEFYEGFLMGINELKKDGISMHIKVLDTPSDQSVTDAIISGELNNRDIVIGGVSPTQLSMISSNIASHTTYVIPFNSLEGNWSGIQINLPQRYILDRVAAAFKQRYEGLELVLVNSNDNIPDEPLVAKLRQLWNEAGYRVRSINIDEQLSTSWNSKSVLLPISAQKQLAQKLFCRLEATSSTPEVFGYPQWQTYSEDFTRLAHKYSATIYTPFFFDTDSKEAKQFLVKYKAWYNKKISNSYPKYSVLGYDLARFFIRGYAVFGKDYLSKGSMLPSDGLQMDIALEPNMQTKDGYINTKFYFVTYQSNGTINRISLQ